MNLTQVPRPPTTPRFSRLAPRWILATLVVAGVFVGGRATMTEPASAPVATDLRPAPKTRWMIPTESTDNADPDIGGTTDRESEPTGSLDNEVLNEATATITGRGADGGTWSMDYPSHWVVHEDPGVTTLDSPDRESVAMVATRPYVGPLDDEAQRDLGVLTERLDDATVDVFDLTTVSGRPAAQAHLDYTTPGGEPASVSVTWIQDQGSLYLVAGEAPYGDPALGRLVTEILNSFTILEAA